MDSLNNYSNLSDIISQDQRNKLQDVAQENADKLNAVKEKFQDQVKAPLEQIGGSAVEDQSLTLLKGAFKSGVSKAKDIGEDVIKSIAKKSGIEEGDIKNFGSRFINAYKENGRKGLTDEISKAKDEIATKAKGLVGDAKGKLGKVGKDAKGLVEDAKGKLGKVETIADDALTGGKIRVKRVKGITKKVLDTEKNVVEDAKKLSNIPGPLTNDVQTTENLLSQGGKVGQLSDAELDTKALLGNIDRNVDRLAPPEPSPAPELEGVEKDGTNLAKKEVSNLGETEVKNLGEKEGSKFGNALKKAGERAGEEDLEGGGPEDVAGDVVAGITAAATLIGGLFSKKKPPPVIALPTSTSQASFQIGA